MDRARGGQVKAYAMPTIGGERMIHLCTYTEKPILQVFCNICKVLLSYFIVFGNDLHYVFKKHFL